ncbi:hypothetical protein ACFVW1_37110 [Streptomyces olivochromogenes]|uniref:hypothetical protein n=1 Tax=Streptomyces olivochromogenes TaxID=1963 RepID=UPI0036D8AEFB
MTRAASRRISRDGLADGGETITDLAVLESTWLELPWPRSTSWLGRALHYWTAILPPPPKKLRYRLLYVTARVTRGGRRRRLRISATWPWRNELATAFHRLAALPRPVT